MSHRFLSKSLFRWHCWNCLSAERVLFPKSTYFFGKNKLSDNIQLKGFSSLVFALLLGHLMLDNSYLLKFNVHSCKRFSQNDVLTFKCVSLIFKLAIDLFKFRWHCVEFPFRKTNCLRRFRKLNFIQLFHFGFFTFFKNF